MNGKGLISFFLLCLLPLVWAGCGDVTAVSPGGVTTLAASASCIGCHGSAVSAVTGGTIADEWKLSHHNTETSGKKVPGVGAGCADCHEPDAGHPNSCGRCHGGTPGSTANRHDVTLNPDTALKCSKCHALATLGSPHFNNYTAVKHQAQFVDLQNVGNCRNCHNPHDTTILPEARDWAKSKHGDVDGVAWSTEDFKENISCLRCHTATGFVNYVTSSPAFTLATTSLQASDSYGVLGCKACHTNYAFKKSVRNIAQYTAPYNGGKSSRTFPNADTSNLCVPCHAARESGDTVLAVTDFTKASFKNSHYLAAAGLMYMRTGFTAFTSASAAIGTSTYGKSLTIDNVTDPGNGVVGGVSSTHRKLGTPLIIGDSHNPAFFIAGNLDANGPCVTCHMNGITNAGASRSTSHTLAISADAFDQVCKNCHSSEAGTPLTGANFRSAFLEPQSEVFQNALKLAVTLLQNNYNIKFDATTYPYFFDLTKDPAGKTAVTDWTRGTGNQKLGLKVMGACFNINLLYREPAAFAHARTYTRRLVYDTTDFLDDGKMNLSVSATATAANPAHFGKGDQAFTDGTLITLSPGTSESMVYLIGWNRTTGKWNIPERP
jgi:formate-dependent nitrite reductase cytochrome c552 subunit